MCGIAGMINVRDARAPEAETLAAMIAQLGHRGPDGRGFYLGPQVGLAHARLSIIDLPGGNQPMCNEDGSVWVVFNGEIFNYLELRAQLEARGHVFHTRSDTEVLVHLYEEKGESFVDDLNGQFAIALWDRRQRRLTLARDRAGIRPLFYAQDRERLYFASEIKALFASAALPRRIDVRGLGEALTFWSPLVPRTVFEGVSLLPPGHVLTIEKGTLRSRRYWDWDFPQVSAEKPRPSMEASSEALEALLVEAVGLQLRADVPVAVYLSGGLDSALIASLVKRVSGGPLRTFSLRFEDREFDEGAYQHDLVRALGSEHTEVVCERGAIARAFPRAVWHAEAPLLRSAPAPMMLLSRAVREHGYKVALTGEGADEVMAGYDLFKEAKVRRFWAREPRSPRRAALLARLYPYLAHSPTASAAYARQFFGRDMAEAARPYFAHLPRWETTQRSWRFLSPDARAALDADAVLAGLVAQLPADIGRWPRLNQDQYIEAHTLMSGYLLSSQGDRMASANAVETRFPYLDHRVIALCNALPANYKLFGLREKFLLKKIARRWLPAAVWRRPKQPYRAPDGASFFGRDGEYVMDLLSESRLRQAGYFDPQRTRFLLDKCRAGRAIGFSDNMAFMGILSTMLLDEMFVRGVRLERPRGDDTVIQAVAGSGGAPSSPGTVAANLG